MSLSAGDFGNKENFEGFSEDVWDFSGSTPTIKGTKLNQIDIQVGAGADKYSSIQFDNAVNINIDNLLNMNLSNVENARKALSNIQETLNNVTEKQSYIGTQLNRLTGIATASQMTIENYSAAKSTVMDTDIAQETANMIKSQILQQVSVSVLAQSKNITGQIALSLIG